jgi:uncharacterized protein (TIGR00369 family)
LRIDAAQRRTPRLTMQFPVHIPFVAALGFQLLRFQDGEAEIHLVPRPEHHNSFEVVHGGVSMTLLDVVMAHAARSPKAGSEPDGRGVVTIEMKTSFMRPAVGLLKARGKVLHRSATMAFTEATILNAADDLVAHATGTFKYLQRLPVDGPGGRREINALNASD